MRACVYGLRSWRGLKNNKGAFYVIFSSVIFGFLPVLAKEGQIAGVNAVTMTFLRMILALPVMFSVLIGRRVDLRINKKELKSVMLLGFFGMAGGMLTLNFAYSFIDVGIATAIHFVYPVLIVLWCIIHGEKKSVSEWLALAVVMTGVVLFIERGGGQNQLVGIGAAFLSGVFYAYYVIESEKISMDYFKLSFYVCAFAGFFMLIFGLGGGSLDFSFGARGWSTAVPVSALSSLCAIPMFQIGVRNVGASGAGVLSTVEPIMGIIFGAVFLGESITFFKIIGSILIVCGIILIEKKK